MICVKMLKIFLDYTFLEAPIFENNRKHETADQLANVIKKESYKNNEKLGLQQSQNQCRQVKFLS